MKKWINVLAGIIAGIMAVTTPVCATVDLNSQFTAITNDIPQWPQGPDIMADTGIVMEYGTGAVIYEKGADEKRYPASITKLMTLLVAVENSSLDETVTFTETGVRDIATDSSNIGMKLGETLTMKQCLLAMIIASANEVAAQIAEHVGGTEQNFVDMMNAKAAEIGCTNTHFANANGLPDENQYTTARDMALIFREGLKNKTFKKIINTRSYTIKPTNMNAEKRSLYTHHPLFSELSSTFYPECIGGKSGRTDLAGSTLVTAARENKITYIVVVLRDADINQSGVDSKALFDYGYQLFQKVEVEGGYVIIPKGMKAEDLVKKEKIVNNTKRYTYYVGDHYVGRGKEVTATPTPQPEITQEQPKETEVQETAETKQKIGDIKSFDDLSDTAKILLMVMAGMAVILFILCIILAVKTHKKNKRHERRS